MGNKLKTVFVIVAACGSALALVNAYHVDPQTAQLSGWTRTIQGQDNVSEILVCCWDSLGGMSGVSSFA